MLVRNKQKQGNKADGSLGAGLGDSGCEKKGGLIF